MLQRRCVPRLLCPSFEDPERPQLTLGVPCTLKTDEQLSMYDETGVIITLVVVICHLPKAFLHFLCYHDIMSYNSDITTTSNMGTLYFNGLQHFYYLLCRSKADPWSVFLTIYLCFQGISREPMRALLVSKSSQAAVVRVVLIIEMNTSAILQLSLLKVLNDAKRDSWVLKTRHWELLVQH